ncbi:MAG: DUF6327 family protein [Arenibacter troitsensis]|nr:DUF6327 family protein [Arenibacter troitsensis]
MKKSEFSSFNEIDQELKILRLQRQVDREQLKFHLNGLKSNFYPTNILGGFKGVAKKLLLSFVAKKILKKLG